MFAGLFNNYSYVTDDLAVLDDFDVVDAGWESAGEGGTAHDIVNRSDEFA